MPYEPTAQDAMAAYAAAREHHHPDAFYQPDFKDVEQLTPDSFRINGKTHIWPTMAFCAYDASRDLWAISLLDGVTVRVRDIEDVFVVVTD